MDRSGFRFSLVAASVLLGFASQAQAARWQPAHQLFAGAEAPQLAVNPRGDAFAAWAADSRGPGGSPNRIVAVQRSAGGAFGKPVTLVSSRSGLSDPVVALAPSGAAVLAWFEAHQLRVRVRPSAKRRFGSVRTLASANTLTDAVAGIDSRGRAVVAWTVKVAGHLQAVASTSSTAGGFGPAKTLSGTGDATLLSLAVNPRGDVAIGWAYEPVCESGTTSPSGGTEAVRTRAAGAAAFKPAVGWRGQGPVVGVSDAGKVTVLSDDAQLSCSSGKVAPTGTEQTVIRNGSVSGAIDTTPLETGLLAEPGSPAIAHDGTLAFLGADPGAESPSIATAVYERLAGKPGTTRRFTGGGVPDNAAVAVDPRGDVVISGQNEDYGALGRFLTPTSLGTARSLAGERENEGGDAGIDDSGRASAVFVDDGGNIVAATYG